MNEKILELQKRTIKVLEMTKKNANKFMNERKTIDNYLRKCNKENDESLQEWENFLINFENIVNKNNEMNLRN